MSVISEKHLSNFIKSIKFVINENISPFSPFAQGWMNENNSKDKKKVVKSDLSTYANEVNKDLGPNSKHGFVVAVYTPENKHDTMTCGKTILRSGDQCLLAVLYELDRNNDVITDFKPIKIGGFDKFYGPRQEIVELERVEVLNANVFMYNVDGTLNVTKAEERSEEKSEDEDESKKKSEEDSEDEDDSSVVINDDLINTLQCHNEELFIKLQAANQMLQCHNQDLFIKLQAANQNIQDLQARVIELLDAKKQ